MAAVRVAPSFYPARLHRELARGAPEIAVERSAGVVVQRLVELD